MSKRITNITSMTESAEEERQHRTRNYLMTMAIRTLCVLLMVFVRGPWLWVVAAGAIFLPWIAVVIANHVYERKLQPVLQPDATAVAIRHPDVKSDQWFHPGDSPTASCNGDADDSHEDGEPDQRRSSA